MSKTSLVVRQYRLREWASMIRECNQRPVGMSVDEWCNSHSITKANYYYRMKQVRKACLEAIPKEPAEQSVVPVPAELMTMEIPADATQIQSRQSVSASLEIVAYLPIFVNCEFRQQILVIPSFRNNLAPIFQDNKLFMDNRNKYA